MDDDRKKERQGSDRLETGWGGRLIGRMGRIGWMKVKAIDAEK
jgi:hypothetical protein